MTTYNELINKFKNTRPVRRCTLYVLESHLPFRSILSQESIGHSSICEQKVLQKKIEQLRKEGYNHITAVSSTPISGVEENVVVDCSRDKSLIEHGIEKLDIQLFEKALLCDKNELERIFEQYDKTEDKASLREQYITGQIFNVGDIVREGKQVFQIVDRGPNFVKVVDPSGNVKNKWIDSLQEVRKPSASLIEQFNINKTPSGLVYKGYKTRNFTKQVAKCFESVLDHSDSFAVLASIRATDQLLEEKDVVEKYNLLQRSERYLKNLNALTQHQAYRDLIESSVAHALLEDIPSILKITNNDRVKTAQFIAAAIGSSQEGEPAVVINKAAKQVADNPPDEDLLPTYGEMFKLADEVGIDWDKTIFNDDQQVAMGFIEKVTEQFAQTILNMITEKVTSFSDIIEAYSADELVVVGKCVRSLNESAEETNTEKAVDLIKKEPGQVKVKQPSTRKQLVSKARRIASKFIHDRKLWKSMKVMDEKDRKKLEAIFNSNGSVISASTLKLADKVGMIEAERLEKLQMEINNAD